MSKQSVKSLSNRELKRIIESGEARGLTLQEFVDKYHVSRSRAYRIHKQYQEELALDVGVRGREQGLIDFLKAHPGEHTIPELGRRFRLPQRSIYVICQEHDLNYKKTNRDDRLTKQCFVKNDPAFIKQGYTVDDLRQLLAKHTLVELGGKFGVSHQAVGQWKQKYIKAGDYHSTYRKINIPQNFEHVVNAAVFKKEIAVYYNTTTYTIDKWLTASNLKYNRGKYPWLYVYGVDEAFIQKLARDYSVKDLANLFGVTNQTVQHLCKAEHIPIRSAWYHKGIENELKPLTLKERLHMSPDQCRTRIYKTLKP